MSQASIVSSPVVYLVEDDPEVRQALSWFLDTDDWELQSFERPSELIDQIDHGRPGCLIVDLSLPEMSGLELCEKLRRDGSMLPFIVISGQGQIPDAVSAMQLGAIDFLQKPLDSEALVGQVRRAVRSDLNRYLDEDSHRDLRQRFESLSQREREVFEQVVLGRSNRQMAEGLDLAAKTIEAHRSKMSRKMHARTVAELVRMAIELERDGTGPK